MIETGKTRQSPGYSFALAKMGDSHRTRLAHWEIYLDLGGLDLDVDLLVGGRRHDKDAQEHKIEVVVDNNEEAVRTGQGCSVAGHRHSPHR